MTTTLAPMRKLWTTAAPDGTPDVVPLYRILTTPALGQSLAGVTTARFRVLSARGTVQFWAATVLTTWPTIVPGAPDAHTILIRHLFTTTDSVTVGTTLLVTPFATDPAIGEMPFAEFSLPVIE
jgi:hypothetical protein